MSVSTVMTPGPIGLIADTHGLLRPEALAALVGCDRILHAGDIGGPEILDALQELAPVTAVRGNNDTADWQRALPEELVLDIAGLCVRMLHDLKQYRPHAEDRIVVTGHSHRPLIDARDGRLYINPGSAGPRRFRLPITVARLYLAPAGPRAEIVPIL